MLSTDFVKYRPFLLRILLIGPPGAGKGTQSKWLRREYNLFCLSSGDVLRQSCMKNLDYKKKLESHMNDGGLLNDEFMVQFMLKQIQTLDSSKFSGLVLDGFPRTLKQAQILDKEWKKENTSFDFIFNLKVPKEIIMERLANRWVHVNSGRVYNLNFNPPLVPFIDDVTNEPLIQREDDKPASVLRRLKEYKEMTEPLLEYYSSYREIINITGSTSDEVYKAMKVPLDSWFGKSTEKILNKE